MKRRSPYRKSAARRAEILEAAQQVFGHSGWRSGSLREVAAAAGISQAGLLHHFPSKGALLIALLEWRDELAQKFLAGRPGLETMANTVTVLDNNIVHRDAIEMFCVLSAEATDPEHPAHAFFVGRYARQSVQVTAAFEQMRESGQLRPGVDPAEVASLTISVMDGLHLRWLLDPASVDVTEGFLAHLRPYLSETAWLELRERRATSVDAPMAG